MTLALTLFTWSLLPLLLILALSQALILLGKTLNLNFLEFYGRSIASFLALFVCACYGTAASTALNVVGKGGLGQWTTARSFKWVMWVCTRVWFDIEDEGLGSGGWLAATRPAVFVGNHQTELDVLFLGHVFPKWTSVTAKKSLKNWPFLGWFMALSKTVFIERTSRTQAVAAFDAAAEQMHTSKQSVYIFPEGTRSYAEGPTMLPFKKGAFHLAVQAQVPIVPIVVANYSAVLNVKRKVFKSGRIPARVLRPVQTKGKGKEDVEALLKEVEGAMLRELEGLMGMAREKGVAVQQSMGDGRVKGVSSGVDVGLNDAARHPVAAQ